jgi:hypothetical protein
VANGVMIQGRQDTPPAETARENCPSKPGDRKQAKETHMKKFLPLLLRSRCACASTKTTPASRPSSLGVGVSMRRPQAIGALGVTKEEMAGKRKTSTKRWVAKVTTDSTHPPKGLFTRSAGAIARALASKKVSPRGPASGMRMLTYFINRAGRGLAPRRRAELQKAKALLSERVRRARARKVQQRKRASVSVHSQRR